MGTPLKADELFTTWSRLQFKTLYLFSGSEDFLIEEAIRRLRTFLFKDDTSRMNEDRLDGETHTVEDVLQVCQTVPFLGDRRLVIIQNTSAFNAKDQDVLAKGLQHLTDATTAVFVWGKEWRRDDAERPLVEEISHKGQVVIFWPLFPENAQRWLLQRARHYQKTLATDAAQWLVSQEGEGLRILDQELFKLSCYVGERPQITLEDAQTASGYDKSLSPYTWVQAIFEHQTAQAMKLLGQLLEEDEEPLRLLNMISNAHRDWLSAKETHWSAPALTARFHLKRGEENRFLHTLATWSENRLSEGLSACVLAEESIKMGKETPEMAMTLLTLALGGQSRYALR